MSCCDCLHCYCCGRNLETEAKELNKKIQKQIEMDKKEYRKTSRILVYGTRNSGKSTLIKQMKILHLHDPFSANEKEQIKADIRKHVIEAIFDVAQSMLIVDPFNVTNQESILALKENFEAVLKNKFCLHRRILGSGPSTME